MNNLKGIIFDFDGTLADTLPLCILSFQQAFEEVTGRKLSESDITRHFGKSEEGIISAIAQQHYDAALKAYIETYRENHYLCPKPFGGVVEILDKLFEEKVQTALITGKGKHTIDVALNYMNLGKYFEYVEHGHPEGSIKTKCILKIAENWGLKPSEIAYIGDQPSDIIESKAAGAVAIAVSWAKTSKHKELEQHNPDRLFSKIEEFREWLNVEYFKHTEVRKESTYR